MSVTVRLLLKPDRGRICIAAAIIPTIVWECYCNGSRHSDKFFAVKGSISLYTYVCNTMVVCPRVRPCGTCGLALLIAGYFFGDVMLCIILPRDLGHHIRTLLPTHSHVSLRSL